MLRSYKLFWTNYVNFRGRTPASGYWWVVLCNFIIYTVLGTIIALTAIDALSNTLLGWKVNILDGSIEYGKNVISSIAQHYVFALILLILLFAYELATIIPGLSLVVRRLHDTGRRWWWICIAFGPGIVMNIITIALAFRLDRSTLTFMFLGWILTFAGEIFFIILMCLPTSPDAIGQSTHEPGEYGGNSSALVMGTAGMYGGAEFPLAVGEELVIGRDAALSHIVINQDAEKVSRQHVSIKYNPESDSYIVVDLSSNGTYEGNGRRLAANVPEILRRGSVIYLAKPNNSFRLL